MMSHLVLLAALASSSLAQCGGAAPCASGAGWQPTAYAAPRMVQAAPAAPMMVAASAPAQGMAKPMMGAAPAATLTPTTVAVPTMAPTGTRMFARTGGLFRGRNVRRVMMPMGMRVAR